MSTLALHNLLASAPRRARPRTVPPAQRVGLAVHRIVPPAPYTRTPLDVARFDVERLGFDVCSYAFIVHGGGVHQLARFDEVTPHAWHQNAHRVGLAVIGDFRSEVPAAHDWLAAVEFVALVCAWRAWDPRAAVGPPALAGPCVAGHTELPRATAYPAKVCPGARWPMERFRDAVAYAQRVWVGMPRDTIETHMVGLGLTLGGAS